VRDWTRPASTMYRLRALVMSVLDAPGKLAVVNIESAGSPVAKPRVAVGTRR